MGGYFNCVKLINGFIWGEKLYELIVILFIVVLIVIWLIVWLLNFKLIFYKVY